MSGQLNRALNVIIVDDEEDACNNLKYILLEYIDPNINILGIANSSTDAFELISNNHPDAIFLDIEMQEEDAFDFLAKFPQISFEVIFVTAYDEHAVKAFKLNAVDYILKPISINELERAVLRLNEKLTYKRIAHNELLTFNSLSEQIFARGTQKTVTLKNNNTIEIVAFSDIYFIEAMGSYAKVVFEKKGIEKDIIVSHIVSDYEDILPHNLFFRIHKSYLVSRNHLKQIQKDDNYWAIVNDKHKLPISRRRYPDLIKFLKG